MDPHLHLRRNGKEWKEREMEGDGKEEEERGL